MSLAAGKELGHMGETCGCADHGGQLGQQEIGVMCISEPAPNPMPEPSEVHEATAVLRAVIVEKLRDIVRLLGQGAGGPVVRTDDLQSLEERDGEAGA